VSIYEWWAKNPHLYAMTVWQQLSINKEANFVAHCLAKAAIHQSLKQVSMEERKEIKPQCGQIIILYSSLFQILQNNQGTH
jgi:hypothetical protein